ncbi:MAG TPA: prepilin-type N-terminal cleavage/methylation domain-containing protein [Candidatus Saccharimonadales bacterium]|nr:prepilin-type N-terminal cleavage/methylation domain-containing protein [Candidatus Saccharimonadales bacterium]
MVSLKNKSKGFTIVELLIVIVVIGILATLVIVTFTGIQQKARDSKRKTDISAIQASLESYYSSNNTYPTVADLNSSTWLAANMKGFDTNALKDPKGNASTVVGGQTPSGTQYAYVVTDTLGTLASPTTCSDTAGATNPCTNFGIYAKLESDGSTISKVSNN